MFQSIIGHILYMWMNVLYNYIIVTFVFLGYVLKYINIFQCFCWCRVLCYGVYLLVLLLTLSSSIPYVLMSLNPLCLLKPAWKLRLAHICTRTHQGVTHTHRYKLRDHICFASTGWHWLKNTWLHKDTSTSPDWKRVVDILWCRHLVGGTWQGSHLGGWHHCTAHTAELL